MSSSLPIKSFDVNQVGGLDWQVNKKEGKYTVQLGSNLEAKAYDCIKSNGFLTDLFCMSREDKEKIKTNSYVHIATVEGSKIYVDSKVAVSIAAGVLTKLEAQNTVVLASTIHKIHEMIKKSGDDRFFIVKPSFSSLSTDTDLESLSEDDLEFEENSAIPSLEVVIGKIGGKWQAQVIEKMPPGGAFAAVSLTKDVAIRRMKGIDVAAFNEDVERNAKYINMIRPGEGMGLGRLCQVMEGSGEVQSPEEGVIVSKRYKDDCLNAHFTKEEVPKMAQSIVNELYMLMEQKIYPTDLKLSNISYEGRGIAKLQDLGQSLDLTELTRKPAWTSSVVRDQEMRRFKDFNYLSDEGKIKNAHTMVMFEAGMVLYQMAQKAMGKVDMEINPYMQSSDENYDSEGDDPQFHSELELEKRLPSSIYTAAEKAIIIKLLKHPEDCTMKELKTAFPS